MSDHGRFIWYELITPDMAGAKRFYGSVVGWNAQDMPAMPGAEPYSVLDYKGDGVAGIMNLGEAMKAEGMPPNWTAYVCVDDCDAAAERAKALGGSVVRPPMDIPGIGRFAIIADPHGAVVAIMTPAPQQAPRRRLMRGELGGTGWHELMAGDVDVDLAFYKGLFGWTETGAHDMGPMGVYHLASTPDGEVIGAMTKPPELPMAFWTLYFEVEDINAAAERVKAAGGSIMMGPMEVPDGSWVLQGADPQGAAFALVRTNP